MVLHNKKTYLNFDTNENQYKTEFSYHRVPVPIFQVQINQSEALLTVSVAHQLLLIIAYVRVRYHTVVSE